VLYGLLKPTPEVVFGNTPDADGGFCALVKKRQKEKILEADYSIDE